MKVHAILIIAASIPTPNATQAVSSDSVTVTVHSDPEDIIGSYILSLYRSQILDTLEDPVEEATIEKDEILEHHFTNLDPGHYFVSVQGLVDQYFSELVTLPKFDISKSVL